MSFLSGLAKVGQIIHTGANIATPFLGLIPGGNVVGTVLQVIFTAESVITAGGSGSLKKETVLAMLHAALPNANPARLSQAVDLIVAAVNLLSNITADPPVTDTDRLIMAQQSQSARQLASALGNQQFVTGMTHDIQGNALPMTTGTVISGPGFDFPGSSRTYTQPLVETVIQPGTGYTAPTYK